MERKTLPTRPNPTMAQDFAPDAGRIPPAPQSRGYFTMANGCPLQDPLLTEGTRDNTAPNIKTSQLIQDLNVLDTIAHITHERIPERYVHAKGVGAFGTFEVTNKDFKVSDYSDAKFLSEANKKTRLFARFSTVAGEKGYPDTVRDLKGLAFKLYTEEGNLDWAFLNPEIFPIRDPSKFPSLVHASKRCPASNLPDATMFWDYFNNHPEGYNALMRIFSDEGTPVSYSALQAHSVHCYTFTKWVKGSGHDQGQWKHTLVRIKLVPDRVIDPAKDYFDLAGAVAKAGADPDWLTRRLYCEIDAARKGDPGCQFPAWKVMAQLVQDPSQSTVNIFDSTKILSEKTFPWKEFGKITLTECPQNFFTQVEQAAFNPANVVPGWDISPDPLLQIRLFAYGETQRYRLGVNNDQLPTNRPCSYVYSPTRRDGAYNMTNYANARNYIVPGDNSHPPQNYNTSFLQWSGSLERFKSEINSVDYQQCNDHYLGLSETMRKHFVDNVVASLSTATKTQQDKALDIFEKINHDLAESIRKGLMSTVEKNKRLAQETLGIVAGAEEPHETPSYVPPTTPNPATGAVLNAYRNV